MWCLLSGAGHGARGAGPKGFSFVAETNTTEPVLRIQDLCVDFATRHGHVRVLDRVSLTVGRGETLGIVGESGCGKSMTALAVMRLIPTPPGRISEGRIVLQGRNLPDLTEREMQDVRGNEVSMIFQEPMTSLNPVFTIGMQISESIRRHQGLSKQAAMDKSVDMLRAVGIPAPEERVRQYPHELSGGLRQRVMIAMALSCEPGLLIADEPTTALDVTVQAGIFDLLLDTQQQTGNATMLITHDMGVIAEVAERVVVMYAGHKVEEGPVAEIIQDPLHPYTRGLIRCAPHLKEDPGDVREELMEIPGIVPDLSQLGSGCPFAPRCDQVMPRCGNEKPGDAAVAEDHRVACWLSGVHP